MNPEERQHLEQELLELQFGCHPDPAAIERRLASDPEAAAIAREMGAFADLLRRASREDAPVVGMHQRTASVTSIARPRPLFRWAAAVAATILLGMGTHLGLAWKTKVDAVRHLRLVVTGPAAMPDGVAHDYRVETWDLEGKPLAAQLSWRVLDREGKVIGAESSLSNGTSKVILPPTLAGAKRLEIEATSGRDVQTATIDLRRDATRWICQPSTDRPAYRPGDVMRWRAVLLDRLTTAPAKDAGLTLELKGPRGELVTTNFTRTTDDGVAAGEFLFADDAVGGRYRLTFGIGDTVPELESLEILVMRFEAPKLETKIRLDRDTYDPGSKGTADISVRRLTETATGAVVTGTVVVDGVTTWSEEHTADAQGETTFAFPVPTSVARGDARFVARCTFGGIVETTVKPFRIPVSTLIVHFYPEGGDLVAGVEQRVYFEAEDAMGRPVDIRGRIVDASGVSRAVVDRSHLGRGRFTITPSANDRLSFVSDDPAFAPVPLPEAVTNGLALTTSEDSYPAGSPITLQVQTPSDGPWLAALFCRGQVVATHPWTGRGTTPVSLAPSKEIAGVLRVTIFDAKLIPVAERLIHRRSAHRLDVTIDLAQGEVSPGASQNLVVNVKDESGRPIAATLGINVYDGAVRDFYGDAAVGLEDRLGLACDVDVPERIDELRSDDAKGREHIDLLLGTRGWRRFAWRDAASLAEPGDDAMRRTLVREGRAEAPLTSDTVNAGDIRDLGTARRSFSKARETFAASAGLVLAGILLVGVFAMSRRLLVVSRLVASFFTAAVAIGGVVAVLNLFAKGDADVRLAGFEVAGQAAAPGAEAAPGDGVEKSVERDWRADADNGVPKVDVLRAEGAIALDDFAEEEAEPREELLDLGDFEGIEEIDARDREALRPNEKEGLGFVGDFEAERSRRQIEQILVREFSHRHRANTSRSDLEQTLYWHPAAKATTDGKVSAKFDTSDRITRWIVTVDAHGANRVGQASAVFTTRLPLSVEMSLPQEVATGDEIDVPLSIESRDDAIEKVQVTVTVAGSIETSLQDRLVAVTDGKGASSLRIKALDVPLIGEGRITVGIEAGAYRDTITRSVRVVSPGFPWHVSKSGVVGGEATVNVEFPSTFVAGTARAEARVHLSRIADLEGALAGLLQEPYGCFEQTSCSHYPNVLAAALLRETGSDAAALARAEQLVKKGYERLLGFECKQRGYEWFGVDPANEALTAYGLLEFCDTRDIIAVDDGMITRTRRFLLDRRDGKGGYRLDEKHLDSFGGAPRETTTAYVTFALLESGEDPKSLADEIDVLEARAMQSSDAYEVALAAHALTKAGRADPARAARTRLKEMQRPDGSLVGRASITSSGGRDLAIETTSFAILAWLDEPADRGPVEKGLTFLLSNRSNGLFGATQATVMALKALCATMPKTDAPATGEIRLSINGKEIASRSIASADRGVIAFDNLAKHLLPGDNEIRFETPSGTELPFTFDLEYRSLQPADDAGTPLEIETRLGTTRIAKGNTVPLTVVVTNTLDKATPMLVAKVGLPSGLEIAHTVLDDLKKGGTIDFWEINGRELVLYWRTLPALERRQVIVDLVAAHAGRSVGPASSVWRYYTPDGRRWAPPLTVTIE